MDENQRYVVLRSNGFGRVMFEVDDRKPAGWREISYSPEEMDAYRIAACLNACDGIKTEELEAGVIEDVRQRLEIMSKFLEYTDGDVDLFTGDWDLESMRFAVSNVLKRMGGGNEPHA